MQRGTRNSGACLKLTHPSNDVSFTLTRGRQTARSFSLSRTGLKSQIFPTPSHLAPSLACRIYEKALRILKL